MVKNVSIAVFVRFLYFMQNIHITSTYYIHVHVAYIYIFTHYMYKS